MSRDHDFNIHNQFLESKLLDVGHMLVKGKKEWVIHDGYSLGYRESRQGKPIHPSFSIPHN